jgi:hypothetical protein
VWHFRELRDVRGNCQLLPRFRVVHSERCTGKNTDGFGEKKNAGGMRMEMYSCVDRFCALREREREREREFGTNLHTAGPGRRPQAQAPHHHMHIHFVLELQINGCKFLQWLNVRAGFRGGK